MGPMWNIKISVMFDGIFLSVYSPDNIPVFMAEHPNVYLAIKSAEWTAIELRDALKLPYPIRIKVINLIGG